MVSADWGRTSRPIDLCIFDFDGVLTDNRVLVFDDGREAVTCTRADGLGFSMLRVAGVRCVIVSTETNAVVGCRAAKLNVPVQQGVDDKATAVLSLCRELGVSPRRTAFVGNDLNDLAAMRLVKHRFCPRDAAPEIKRIATKILKARGGEGVAREIAQRLPALCR